MGLRQRLGRALLGSEMERSYTVVTSPPVSGYRQNWWQLGMGQTLATDSSAVYACVSIIAQEISRLRLRHYRDLPGGGRTEVKTSPAARTLHRPNHYQTRSDFMLYLVAGLLTTGKAFATATRDRSMRITALHPRHPWSVRPLVDERTGSIFYDTSPIQLAPEQPERMSARDVMHLRCFTDPGGLEGVSPLKAAAFSIAHTGQVQAQQTNFFGNSARPDGILTTKGTLTPTKVKALQQQWNEAFSGANAGNTAVLEGDLEWQQLSLSAEDLAIISTLNWGVDDICRVFRVPLWMVARTETSTYNNVETMGRAFHMQTLGFWVSHIEEALGVLFDLPAGECIRFDVEEGLMRSEFAPRVKALGEAIEKGVYTPNEARAVENLPPEPGGDALYLQAQMEDLDSPARNEPDPPAQTPPAPTPLLDELTAERSRSADLERQLSLQRMEHAAEAGSLRANLARAESASGATP